MPENLYLVKVFDADFQLQQVHKSTVSVEGFPRQPTTRVVQTNGRVTTYKTALVGAVSVSPMPVEDGEA